MDKLTDEPIIEETPLVTNAAPQSIEGRAVGDHVGRQITSDETIADRPVRKYFLHIVFILLGVMALATVFGMLFIRYVHPRLGGPTTGRPNATGSSTPQGSAHPQ